MQICMNDMLYAFSYALDSVEHELLGATTYHSKRVACLCSEMGHTLHISNSQLLDLTACAVLHDNALTEYISEEYKNGVPILDNKGKMTLSSHCTMGERNICHLPFYEHSKGAILYHHENADGSGPFHKTADETPLYAQLIHLADQIDVRFNLNHVTAKKYTSICTFLEESKGTLFEASCVDTFLKTFPLEKLQLLYGQNIDSFLHESLPLEITTPSNEDLIALSSLFAKIIDYKSPFTCNHSLGIAQKALEMGIFYHFDEETQAKLYFAGAVHDVGKLVVDTDILEKPGKLTKEEYTHIQNHAYATYDILHRIQGLEDITSWASLHHEKLDGSGYPFQKTAAELGQKERLMACLDIYQALRESRPYKEGMPHEKAIHILQDMANQGQLDASIVQDIDTCFKI